MRPSPLLLLGTGGALAASYTEHGRGPYNASVSAAATLARGTGSASGYLLLPPAPTTLRSAVRPALSANWTAPASTYGAEHQETETSPMPSPPPSAPPAFANYTAAANGSMAAAHAPVPSARNATVSVTPASASTHAPVYTAAPHRRPYAAVPHKAAYNSSSPPRPLPPPAPAAYPTVAVPLNGSFAEPEPAISPRPGPGEAEGSAPPTASGPEIKTFWMALAAGLGMAQEVEGPPAMR